MGLNSFIRTTQSGGTDTVRGGRGGRRLVHPGGTHGDMIARSLTGLVLVLTSAASGTDSIRGGRGGRRLVRPGGTHFMLHTGSTAATALVLASAAIGTGSLTGLVLVLTSAAIGTDTVRDGRGGHRLVRPWGTLRDDVIVTGSTPSRSIHKFFV